MLTEYRNVSNTISSLPDPPPDHHLHLLSVGDEPKSAVEGDQRDLALKKVDGRSGPVPENREGERRATRKHVTVKCGLHLS